MCRRKCECNLLGLCFQRGKPGCDLANCRHQPLKGGYGARVPRALARLPIASPRGLLSTAPTKRVSHARHGWKPGGFEETKGPGPREGGEWGGPVGAPSRSCARSPMTRSERMEKVKRGGVAAEPFPSVLVHWGSSLLLFWLS